MKGHDRIRTMRRNGQKPLYVWIADGPSVPHPLTVTLDPADVPEQLDLRFLVGVTAIVEGDNAQRVERIAAACGQQAKRVVATTYKVREVSRITDSEGVLTWPN